MKSSGVLLVGIVAAVVVLGGGVAWGSSASSRRTLELAIGIATVVVIAGGLVVWLMSVSNRARSEMREQVSITNKLLRDVARATGLRLLETGSYSHPMVGDIPGYDRLTGEVRGQPIRLEVERDEVSDHLLVLATPPPGRSFPKLGRIDGPRSRAHPQLAPLLAAMGDHVVEVRVGPEELRVVVEGSTRGSALSHYYKLPREHADVIALVEATASLATTLVSLGAPASTVPGYPR